MMFIIIFIIFNKIWFFPFNFLFINIYKYFSFKELEFLLIIVNNFFIFALFFKLPTY